MESVMDRIMQKVRESSTSKYQNGDQEQTHTLKGMSQCKCELCNDIGFIIKRQENSQPLMTPCKCLEIEKVKRLWNNSGINIDNFNKNFSNFEEWSMKSKEMKAKATDYYKSFNEIRGERRNSILLCGNPGSGKTHSTNCF